MSSSDPVLRVERLASAWDGVPVLRDVSFDVAPGELLSLLGPNGSGKTTLLRCLAGLERPTSGEVWVRGTNVSRWPTHRRGIGWMSQEPALFPHRSVLENVAYGPLLARRSEGDVRAEVGRLLELLRLVGFEDRRPDQLSGGERQRVALARTLAARPTLVLLDEPFASIDVELRSGLRAEFRRVLRELGIAAIHVTHDREEGLFLGDRVGLLFDGRLERLGRPREVYERPDSVRSARLLGYNVWREAGGPIAVLPRHVRIGPAGTGRRPASIVAAGDTGAESLTIVALADGSRLEVRSPDPVSGARTVGEPVGIDWADAVELPEPPAPAKEPKNGRTLRGP